MNLKITGDVYGMGDIHGDITTMLSAINYYDIKDCTLILLGDIGVWRYRDYKHYKAMDDACRERNIMVYALRGNHDNPAFFLPHEDLNQIGQRFWDKFTNFKQLPDLTILDINGSKGIVIGGATSIDRCIRRNWQKHDYSRSLYASGDWWRDEKLPETDKIDEKVDFILSHVGPRPIKTPLLSKENCSFMRIDMCLEADLLVENARLEEIQRQFTPKKWWFGHFHVNDNFEFFNTRCYAVDICHIVPIQI